MGKSELFSHFADRFEVKRTQAREFFDELNTLAEKELKRSGEFVLPGMVKLVVQKRKARMGRNPATGEAIKIPAKTVVKARIAKQLKDAVLPEEVGRVGDERSGRSPRRRPLGRRAVAWASAGCRRAGARRATSLQAVTNRRRDTDRASRTSQLNAPRGVSFETRDTAFDVDLAAYSSEHDPPD